MKNPLSMSEGAMIFLNVGNYQVFNGGQGVNCQKKITNSTTGRTSKWMKLFNVSLS
jgi:uncharacterized RmlC-like cupin family protein